MYCSKCGKEIANDSKFCEHCGNEVNNNRHLVIDKRIIIMIVLVLISIVIICIGIYIYKHNNNFTTSSINTANPNPKIIPNPKRTTIDNKISILFLTFFYCFF